MEKSDYNSKKNPVWIVDYDMEANKPCRRRFYKAVKKVIGEEGLTNSTSSKSVLRTSDKKIAKTVHRLASSCGISHIYKVVEADE